MGIYSEKSIKKGFGLVEALIALLLVASTMILAIRTVSIGVRSTKDNEIRDTAAGVMLRALEYNQLDLPSTLVNADFSQQDQTYCYKLDDNNDLILVDSTCSGVDMNNPDIISDCLDNSSYLLTNTPGVNICNQIIFTNVTAGANAGSDIMSDKIRITSIVVYYIQNEDDPQVERVDTYRQLPLS
ncbi:hypothetical protein GF362_05215 [Candidatus Dojkabacteria bacterium]|nr:hypothetical protein [Candidatus Dojkabacteria bacterium]